MDYQKDWQKDDSNGIPGGHSILRDLKGVTRTFLSYHGQGNGFRARALKEFWVETGLCSVRFHALLLS